MSNVDLARYYAERAPEYERIYAKPERQSDLAKIREFIRSEFAGKHVLEIACGTGYWTEVLASSTASVYATDINEEVLAIARAKPAIANNPNVRLVQADAYALSGVPESPACLIAFWWSHIPKGRVAAFLDGVHSKLQPGATVVAMDNRYVASSSTPVHRRDAEGNEYQLRKLADGSTHEVLKNFPSEAELKNAVAKFTNNASVELLEYYWILRYTTRATG
jgi:SAM-dependent methyltransferase